MIHKSGKMANNDQDEKGNKSNAKSDKEIDKIDREFLSKAKDSRDMIDKKLRTFESTIDVISETIKHDKDTEIDKNKKSVGIIEKEVVEAQDKLNSINKKIVDKKDYYAALEEKINELQQNYNRKLDETQNLEEQLKITKESKANLQVLFILLV